MTHGPPTVLVTIDPDESAFTRIRAALPGCEIRVGPYADHAIEMPPELLRGVDFMLCEFPPVNFDDFDQLKWIQLTSAGYDHMLQLPVLERGIRVTNGLGNFDIPIAEWNIMMMLIWQRDLPLQMANQDGKVWDRDARFQRDIFGSTIGFLGYGGIARETARLAKALHLEVWAMTRDGEVRPRPHTYCVHGSGDPEGILPDRVFAPAQMEAFMGGLDYFLVTLPLTPATAGLIGEKELRMLKPEAVLINPARANIIPQETFARCLRERWIRGASVDVHYAYPLPPDHPVWELPNLILTAHVSGSDASPHYLQRAHDIFAGNCERYARGDTLLNELTRDQLAGK